MSLERSKFKGIYDFRQGSVGRLEVAFFNYLGELIPQVNMPTVEVLYIDLATEQPATAVEVTPMYEQEFGRYYYDWYIPINQPTIPHQVQYKGIIEDLVVVGEDIVTVLPGNSQACCIYTPTAITCGAPCYKDCDPCNKRSQNAGT